jgi:predicted nuclease with TOPRIM domain
MLTQEDLKNIGVELGKVIEQNITPALEQMATKEDLKSLQKQIDHVENQMATKDDLKEMEERLNSKIAAVQSELEDIRQKLDTLSLRTKEDDDSVIKDIFALRRRVDELETQVKQMKLNQS